MGCGQFTWDVVAPPPPPAPPLKDQVCTPPFKHSDVHDGVQDTWTTVGCNGYADTVMQLGSPDIYWHVPGALGDWYDNWKISWISGCTSFSTQNASLPIPGDSHTCYQLLREDYKNCELKPETIKKRASWVLIILTIGNNGGAGGYREAGCLHYEFYVSG